MAWIDPGVLAVEAVRHGFKARGKQNWLRRVPEFIQLINLQKSAWSHEDNYLNFALWPLALGDLPSIAESKFHFRARSRDLTKAFELADQLQTISDLRQHLSSGKTNAMITLKLQGLLAG